MKIVAIADTHGKHDSVELPDGDVLVHAGDLSSFGNEFNNGLIWLKNRPFDHICFVLGNHEKGGTVRDRKKRVDQAQEFGIHVLDEAAVSIDGTRFGSASDQGDLDVLVTHQPPKGVLDEGKYQVDPHTEPSVKSLGSPAVKDHVKRTEPEIHIFGHLHSNYGRETRRDTTFINCALAGPDYEPVNDPVVIDV